MILSILGSGLVMVGGAALLPGSISTRSWADLAAAILIMIGGICLLVSGLPR